MKTDPPKTVPIPSLRTVTSNVTPRFITAPVSSNINTVPLTIQNAGGKPITIPSSGGQTGHKSDVTIAVLPMTNRIIPASGAPTTGYHIPRGPAAVANISVPRGSMATPIRGAGNIAVATTGNSSFMPGLSVLRPWIPAQSTVSGNNPPTSIRPITNTMAPTNFVPATVRHSSMTVATKVNAGPRMQTDQQNPRPQTVLLQKQIITGPNTTQMVHMTDGSKGFIKAALPLPLRSPATRLLSPQAGGKLPVFPILVPSGASILKTQAQSPLGSKVMVSQSTHGTPIQITSVPNHTSIKTTGFPTSSNNQVSTAQSLASAKSSLHPVIVTSATPNKYPNIVSTPNTSSFTPVSNNPSFYYEQGSSPHPPPPPSTISSGPNYPASTGQQLGVRHGSNFAPVVTSLPHSRPPHQPSTIISAPRGMGPAQFSLPINRVSGPQPSVLVASRPHFITSSSAGPGSSAIVTTGPNGMTRFSQISTSGHAPMIHEVQPRHSGASTFTPVSCEGSGDESASVQGALSSSSAIKPNASPRPSILRKRDVDTLTPVKAQKNLTPLLNAPPAPTCSVSNIITSVSNTPLPPSPSSPPKRPDSGSGSSSQSSSSSTSSNGGPPAPDGCDVAPPAHPEEPPLPPTSALISGLSLSNCPVEMSPRKKPRKQLLTGDLQERKMEGEDMEFITEEKIKSEQIKEENGGGPDTHAGGGGGGMAAPCVPPAAEAAKKPHVSLLQSYRQGWKSRHHHFMRYSDVKPKDERRPSLSDIAGQKHILQKVNGWKIYHLRAQLENMANTENDSRAKLTGLLETLDKMCDPSDREVERTNELIKGNIQRHNVVQDQLLEAHSHLMKIFKHKSTVNDLITKNGNRRTIKKKDKY